MALSSAQVFEELCREFGAELTLYLKRLRKNTKAKFRYLLVAEKHKSGLPHFHALIHEEEEGGLLHAQLTSTWKLGFTKFKVVNAVQTAWYVAKYLAKSSEARVRASRCYGQSQGQEMSSERHSAAQTTQRDPPRHSSAVQSTGGKANKEGEVSAANETETIPDPQSRSSQLSAIQALAAALNAPDPFAPKAKAWGMGYPPHSAGADTDRALYPADSAGKPMGFQGLTGIYVL